MDEGDIGRRLPPALVDGYPGQDDVVRLGVSQGGDEEEGDHLNSHSSKAH